MKAASKWVRFSAFSCTEPAIKTLIFSVVDLVFALTDVVGYSTQEIAGGKLTCAGFQFSDVSSETATLASISTSGLLPGIYDTMEEDAPCIMIFDGNAGYDNYYFISDAYDADGNEVTGWANFSGDLADDEIVVIDTAPTGHTLLLLESTESYDKEIQRTKGETLEAVKKLLPRLKSAETEVIIVTLPEATPVYEALRLEEDLERANLDVNWWVINQSFSKAKISNSLLKTKASSEVEWINRVEQHTNGKFAVIAWSGEQIKGEKLLEVL